MKLLARKLYQVRVRRDGDAFSAQVGHKGRLLPRHVAMRVAARLRRNGLEATADPLNVRINEIQGRWLGSRYGKEAPARHEAQRLLAMANGMRNPIG